LASPRIGLALGAGGARGWAHIGVIRALAEAGVRPDIVCGTSIGALVGGAHASGEIDRLERWVASLGWKDVLGLVDIGWRGGFIRGEKLFDFFRSRVADRDIAALGMPFGAVATEIDTGREVWLREGSVMDAVRASIAIPGVFAPVMREGRLLVDGGLVNPVPVSLCRALGAEVVIAVDLGMAKLGYFRDRARARAAQTAGDGQRWWARWLPPKAEEAGDSMPSALNVFMSSMDVMQVRIGRSRLAGEPADLLITPVLPDMRSLEFHRAAEAMAEGRAATVRMRPMLEHLLGA